MRGFGGGGGPSINSRIVRREPLAVSCYGLVEAARFHAIEHGEVCIQHDLLTAHKKDPVLNSSRN